MACVAQLQSSRLSTASTSRSGKAIEAPAAVRISKHTPCFSTARRSAMQSSRQNVQLKATKKVQYRKRTLWCSLQQCFVFAFITTVCSATALR